MAGSFSRGDGCAGSGVQQLLIEISIAFLVVKRKYCERRARAGAPMAVQSSLPSELID
jgi:hypothetical protein